MTFEEMLKALMNGKKIRKKAWDMGIYRMLGDGKYIIDQEGNESEILIDGSFDADVWEEYKEDILDKEEKEYLRAVIKPFRDRVHCIFKAKYDVCNQRLYIKVKKYDWDDDWYDDEEYEEGYEYEYINLPYFKENTEYIGMELGKEYTLEELGL